MGGGKITESIFLGWGKYTRGMVAINFKGLTLSFQGEMLGNVFFFGGENNRNHTYLGEILGRGKQKYSRIGYSVIGFRPKA